MRRLQLSLLTSMAVIGALAIALAGTGASIGGPQNSFPVKRSGAARAIFYVATSGSDRNSGTEKRPFATLARARDAVRRLKSAGPLKSDVIVLIRGGT